MTDLQITSLHFIDWIIVESISHYRLTSLFLQKVRNMVDFVGAGRQLVSSLVASMAGTEMGLITIILAQKDFQGAAAFHIAVVAGIIVFSWAIWLYCCSSSLTQCAYYSRIL